VVDEFCPFCKANNVTTCCHRAVNDDDELTRKQDWLVRTLISDIQGRMDNPTMTFKQCVPDGEHKCQVGFTIKRKKRTP
jgi:hypothetical protein